jgi:tetratricopeptide (TPR) repeat protein
VTRARPVVSLRAAPVTVPCLAAVAVLGWFAAEQGGYPVSVWAPGGIVVIALLGVAVATVPNDWSALPRSLRSAVALLGGYVIWSYLSLAWADDRGAAWTGASRTLMYFAIFCLFALWRQRAKTAAALLGLWTLVVAVIAAVVAVRLLSVTDARTLFPGGRLQTPTGYPNATAALFLMALWPALGLAAARRLPALLRGLSAAAAVLTGGVALLALSRGSVFAVPLCAIFAFAVLRDRVRRATIAIPIAAAIVAAVPSSLHLTNLLGEATPPPAAGAAHSAATAIVIGALLAGVVVTVLARLEVTRLARPLASPRTARGARLAYAGALVIAVAGALAVAGNPITRLDNAWHSFKGGYTVHTGSRLAAGLGSNRYDFYRVALDQFADHPVAGIGADNFYEQYLRQGRSDETPRYPHSVELRTLAETGLIGALLLFGALIAAGAGALRAARARSDDGLRPLVAGGALLAFIYWFLHGSFDWFFEYGGLGAAAFALLGLACSLDPRRLNPRPTVRRLPRPLLGLPVGAVLAAGAIMLAGLWGADYEINAAGATFATKPNEAFARLARARNLNPFDDTADTVAGGIALRFGTLAKADDAFSRALSRSPDDEYATLERGAIASALGQRAEATAFLQKAVHLAPRDPIAADAMTVVRTGGSIDLDALTRRILTAADEIR